MSNYAGLTKKEAEEKLITIGKNEIPEPRGVLLKKIFSWIFSFISLMLIAAAAISYLDGRMLDFYFISFLWVVNFFIGFWHEKKADDAVKKLQAKLSVAVNVFRDNLWQQIPALSLVPGDIISLGGGKIIPADVKFIEAKNVSVNESALTGESLPKEKIAGDVSYSGSFLTTGIGIAEVTATGKSTYFGKTLLAVEKSKKRSILEDDILSIASFLAYMSICAVIILTGVFIFLHKPITDLLTLDLSLMIAGIPVSLPTVMTLIISLGVLELVKKNVVVRRLSSLEDLSNVDLLLSDKTGTLTKNELSVSKIIHYNNFTDEDVITFAYAAISTTEPGSIDTAISEKFNSESVNKKMKILDFTPADSERKRTTSLAEISGSIYTISMGAAQVIERLVKINSFDANRFESDIQIAADGGYRVLAVAFSKEKIEENMTLAGLLLISDTPESDAQSTVAFMKENNIDVKILTGDNMAISERLGKEMGLTGKVTNGTELQSFIKNPDNEFFENTSIFSEILPSDKLNLVEFAKKNHRVAVTGDGVNDIPAVKAADVGIAVKNAVDALKGAADIVLLYAGISVIKDAIIEARKIFARLYTYALYRISESLRLIISIAILGLIYFDYPMTPVQILILALLNDIPIISLAYDRVKIASRPAVVNAKKRAVLGSLFGIVGVANSVIFVIILRKIFHLDWNFIQTLFFLKLSIGGHMLIYVAHTKEKWYKFLPSNIVITVTTLTQVFATLLAVFGVFMSPIKLTWAIAVWAWAFFWMQVSEIPKMFGIQN